MSAECSIDGCPRPAWARGWCGNHYQLWRKNGDPNINLAPRLGPGNERIKECWKAIRQRTTNPNNPNWRWYGAKGVTLCDEWQDFQTFQAWALANGYADDLTIDRIDPDGNYEPSNCRWIPKAENSRRVPRRWAIPEGWLYRMHIEHQQGESQRSVASRWDVSQTTVRAAKARF